MTADDIVNRWAALREHGWLLLRAQAVDGETLTAVARTLASRSPGWQQPIGAVSTVRAVEDSPYAPLRQGGVALHNDGMHLRHPPRYLLLACRTPAARGGQTLLVRGVDAMRRMDAPLLDRLRRTPLRITTGAYQSRRPLVGPHPDDGDELLNFFDPSLADDAAVRGPEGEPVHALLDGVRAALAAAPVHAHAWQQGDVLVIDNLRVLHGRSDYAGERTLLRLPIGPYLGAGAHLP